MWLVTDTALDRPVLARVVGPNAGPQRRQAFTDGVRAMAAVTHDHLAAVYAADEGDDTAYAVTEWAGGVTIADRIEAGEPIPLDDFLPNAAGLADALAKVHAAGFVHGVIGPDAVLYSAAHPAKLSPYASLEGSRQQDTADLAATLVAGLAGGATELEPSQLAEGLPRSVDTALRAAREGRLDAGGLAAALRSAPSPATPVVRPEWSWRWAGVAAVLAGVALVVIVLGFALDASSDSSLLFPVGEPTPPPTVAPSVATTQLSGDDAPLSPPSPGLVVTAVGAFDPFGDGTERDGEVGSMLDGQASTSWRTERYFDPLQLIKPGVGVVFTATSASSGMSITGTPGTAVMVGWAKVPPVGFAEWTPITTAVLGADTTVIEFPEQPAGAWLLWLTDLPPRDGGEFHYTNIAEVVFTS